MAKPLSDLRLSDDIVLPLDAVTETFAFIAKRRVGKSNAAVVLAEQMYYAGIPWVTIDPKGDWWGVRSSADGKGEGLAVVVFGGKHGDRPLHPDSGAFMADLIVKRRLTCILDVSEFSQADKIRFLLAFATRLLQVNEEPVHLFFEECDDYIPQNLIGKSGGDEDETKLVRAFSRLIRHGGFKGIGASLITQRAALVSKNVLAQVDTFIALRTTEPLDIKVVNDRLRGHPSQKEIATSLPALPAGDAWIISPAFLEVYARTTFYRRTTFDSGRTPKIGEKRVIPTKLAEVELDEITAAMSQIIEQVELSDPDKLTKKIAQLNVVNKRLEKQLAEAKSAPAPAAPAPEPEIVTVVPDEVWAIYSVLRDLSSLLGTIESGSHSGLGAIGPALDALEHAKKVMDEEHKQRKSRPARTSQDVRSAKATPAPQPSVPKRNAPTQVPAAVGDVKLGLGERKVLNALAQYHEGLDRARLAFIAGYSKKASTIDVVISKLRKAGLVAPGTGQGANVKLSAAGVDAIGGYQELPSGAELLEHWRTHKRVGAGERKVLDVLIDSYPDDITRSEICEMAGYSPEASTIDVILSKLRKLGLVQKGARVLVDEFAEAIAS